MSTKDPFTKTCPICKKKFNTKNESQTICKNCETEYSPLEKSEWTDEYIVEVSIETAKRYKRAQKTHYAGIAWGIFFIIVAAVVPRVDWKALAFVLWGLNFYISGKRFKKIWKCPNCGMLLETYRNGAIYLAACKHCGIPLGKLQDVKKGTN